MSQRHLEKFFSPESIAVVGASERDGSIGRALMENLINGGFESVIPVNPKRDRVFERKAFARLADLDDAVDLAVIATPIKTVPDIIEQCADKGVHAAIVISAGGKEIGDKGKETEDRIKAAADRGGVRIIGPNCLGVARPGAKLNASFAAHMPIAGNLAFISQSGAICTAILGISIQERIGFSHFISIGSMLDVDFGDLIDFLGNESDVESILLYVENIPDTRKFMSAARAVSRVKPIVLLKAGRSGAGAQAAASHTGAMAGEDAVYDAAFKRAGIIRVKTIGELFECAELMAKQPRPRGNRLGIITNSGGGGVMAADALSEYGVAPAQLSEQTLAKLDEVLPPYWCRNNPIDILGDAPCERYVKAVETCADAEEIDGMLIILNPQAATAAEDVAEAVAGTLKNRRFSVFTAFTGGVDVAEAHRILNQSGIPTYDTPEQAIRAFMYMYEYERNLNLLQEIPPRLSHDLLFDRDRAGRIIFDSLDDKGRFLTELDSKELLSAYGLPVVPTRFAASAEDAVRLAGDLGYPAVMKIHSRDIPHKSDAGGVRLDLAGEAGIRKAFDEILENARRYNPQAELTGVTVAPMIPRPELEVLFGAYKDPNFGPVILFGMGGIFTEITGDRAIALPPLNRKLARFLVNGTKIGRLLKGYRNIAPVDMESIEEIIIRLSQLVIDFPQIEEIDMNPVIIKDGAAHVADARVRVTATDIRSPHHLVISPYPKAHESNEKTRSGEEILVRPIKPEDAPLFEELFDHMSDRSIRYRFFNALRHLPKQLLARFTIVDYDRQIAVVAIRQENGREKMLGACRIIADPDGREGEFSMMVADQWQGQGIGGILLKKCLDIARKRNLRFVTATVLPENRQMLKLSRHLGFEIKQPRGSREMQLRIDLKKSASE